VIDTRSPEGAKFHRMARRLVNQRPHYQKLDDYYRGANGIPVYAGRQVQESYRRLMNLSGANFARLIVEATRERMTPLGFRTGAVSDELGDSEAWRIWQANSLDADHILIDRATLTMGKSFSMIGGVDPEIGAPLITAEDPREVICETDPARRRKVTAALKLYVDEDAGMDRAVLFPMPGWVLKAERKRTGSDTGCYVESVDLAGWNWVGAPERLPADVVPVVPFLNLAGIDNTPEGEFEAHLATLDRINYTILSRLEAMTMQAYRQRAIKGLPLTDDQGEIDYSGDFLAGPGELWQLPATAEIWESGVIDLNPVLMSEKQDITTLAGATSTPMSYLFPDDGGGSAEGASLKRESITFKARDRMLQQGESYEQTMAIAFMFSNDSTRASRGDMELMWAAAERYTLNEKAQAFVQYRNGGVPLQTAARIVLQMTPQEIARMEAEAAVAQLLEPEPSAV
jgi:hypothetical protein